MSDDDALLREKYPSMYEGESEKSDIADVKSDDTTPSLGGSKSKPKKGTENSLPLAYRGSGQAAGRKYYLQQRLIDYDEAASASTLPDWLIVSLRQRLETEMKSSVSIFDLKDNDVYTFKGILSKLNLSFPEGAKALEKRSEKYPSMGTPRNIVEGWCREGYEEPESNEEETEIVEEM